MPVKRSDLSVIYKHQAPPKSPYASSSSVSGLVNQSTPMIAMFLKNKFLAWFALIQSFYAYLNFSPEETSSNSSNPSDQSPGLRVAMSVIGLFVCYMGLVFPQPAPASFSKAPDASASATAAAAATSS
ncbi:hypothetical protein ZYGR_0I06830 [Zygosaccharomyces rouxii]|uniref:ZYRO0C16170p n=2 Tax=Zygosaccharomyces rouxii TaxID=4956 RepID=C5DUE8_ZYGRC|nr:uncharacterized protein ZYRO0C16170g [Zygosaccharomyces rouxii]GAV48386.1 hypothetical protein ZYGR_0I06830 [Zygosaccharomyces rouxii]CAR27409.1 ZYRO0C16170p [Zygosaccharomyces rouxii]